MIWRLSKEAKELMIGDWGAKVPDPFAPEVNMARVLCEALCEKLSND